MFEVLEKIDELLTEEEKSLMAKFDEVNRLMGDKSIGDADLTHEQNARYFERVEILEKAISENDEELAFRIFIEVPRDVLLDAQKSENYEYKRALYLAMGVNLDDAIALVVKVSNLAFELASKEQE